jgi:fluoride exporter
LLIYSFYIALGAVLGALSRYYLGIWFVNRFGHSFPYGTLLINLSGCFVIGFFLTLVSAKFPALLPELKLMVTVGFLGSYTTFSSYAFEAQSLFEQKSWLQASLYLFGSPLLGLAAVQLGGLLGRSIK